MLFYQISKRFARDKSSGDKEVFPFWIMNISSYTHVILLEMEKEFTLKMEPFLGLKFQKTNISHAARS